MRVIGRLVALGVVLAGLLAGAQPADAVQFDFTVDHCTGGCGTPPFGTVTLSQIGTAVDVTVHLNSPNWFVKTGAGAFQAFGFNANGVVVGDITVDPHTPALAAAALSTPISCSTLLMRRSPISLRTVQGLRLWLISSATTSTA